MAEPGEPLQVRVDDEHRDGYRPQPAHDRVELRDGHEEHRKRRDGETEHLDTCESPAGKLTDSCARVARVELGVDEPVQRHRKRPRPDHRNRYPHDICESRPGVDRQERADVSERKREHGVFDPHERCETPRQWYRSDGHVWW